jgi:hypothetical protein
MFVSLTPVFLGSLSCRPATISKFFGDQKPDCAGACDYCRDPKAVRAQLEKGATLCTKTGAAWSTQPRGLFGFDRDLYARGRMGYGFERSEMQRSSSLEASLTLLVKVETDWLTFVVFSC